MKNLFLICFILLSISSIAQELKYSELQGQKPKIKGPFTSYISKSGEVYSVGDTIQLGIPSGAYEEFNYVQEWGLKSLTRTTGRRVSNLKIPIEEILLVESKKAGRNVRFKTKEGNGGYFIFVEHAIEAGEMKSKGITSDEALTELKKAKDKLDLGLINQTQYDSIKSMLVKYIK